MMIPPKNLQQMGQSLGDKHCMGHARPHYSLSDEMERACLNRGKPGDEKS
jgi:hypothetical protein